MVRSRRRMNRGLPIRSESPYMQMVYHVPESPVCGEGEYEDSRIFGDGGRWPLTQKAILNVPAGEVINFSTIRRVPLACYVTVLTGICDVFIDPANPSVDQPDMRFAKDVKPATFRLSPGGYKFYIFAGDSRALQASLIFVDLY